MSLYSARAQLLAAAEDLDPLDVPATLVAEGTEEQFEYLRRLLRTLPETADLAHPAPLHPWGGFVTSTAANPLDTRRLHHAARDFDDALSVLTARQPDPELVALTSAPWHLECWATLANAPRHPLDAIDALHARALSGEVQSLQSRLITSNAARPWFSTVSPEALDGDVHSVHRAAAAADASGFFGRRKRQRAVSQATAQPCGLTPARSPPHATSHRSPPRWHAQLMRSGPCARPSQPCRFPPSCRLTGIPTFEKAWSRRRQPWRGESG